MKSDREMRAWRRKQGNNQNASFDAIDREAEAHGAATRFFNSNELKPQMGRRLTKITNQLNGRRKTADAKATANIVKDTAERARELIIKRV